MDNATEYHFIYIGGGRGVIPLAATHVSNHPSVTVIPAYLFAEHPNIIELICHAGVKRIKEGAFMSCPCLMRVVIPGVEVVEESAFAGCQALRDIKCPKLERIEESAFEECKFLGSINLPSAQVVERNAFFCCTFMRDARFGKNLQSIREEAFPHCPNLKQITIPLKNDSINEAFRACISLKHVDLVEREVLRETVDALLCEEWRNDMNELIDSINQILPSTHAGGEPYSYDMGRKGRVIQEWIDSVLRKIIYYKAQHRHVVNMAEATLQLALPGDVVTNNILPFLSLPLYTFEEYGGRMSDAYYDYDYFVANYL